MTESMTQLLGRPKDLVAEKARVERQSVAVFAPFSVTAFFYDSWFDAWKQMGRIARQQEGCIEFRLFREKNAPTHCYLMSRWDGEDSLHRFFRRVNLPWIERDGCCSILPNCFIHGQEAKERGLICEAHPSALYEELSLDG
jgi:heme-degrading monooxygenase HmoA